MRSAASDLPMIGSLPCPGSPPTSHKAGDSYHPGRRGGNPASVWDRHSQAARGAVAALEQWSSGRRFSSFTEEAVDPGTIFDAGTLARLRTVRAQFDPAGIFAATHDIG